MIESYLLLKLLIKNYYSYKLCQNTTKIYDMILYACKLLGFTRFSKNK